MLCKQAWLIVKEEKKPEGSMYAGIFNKIKEENQAIKSQSQAVSGSFESFDKLFGNLREIKQVMNNMKASSG
jgi:hypothetical protein